MSYYIGSVLFYIFLGILPSIIWLLFYLRKDSHPESNIMVIKIFIYGMLTAIIAAGVELAFLWGIPLLTNNLPKPPSFLSFILYHFVAIALIEEYLKYLTVKLKVLKNPEFDEPVDAMLYMIIVALGFAALENILVLFPTGKLLIETISISVFRFISATFLHALASGIIGYFLALSLFKTEKRFQLISFGMLTATILHGIYNIFIIKTGDNFYFLFIPTILLTLMAIFVSWGFRRLKKIKSVCQIK